MFVNEIQHFSALFKKKEILFSTISKPGNMEYTPSEKSIPPERVYKHLSFFKKIKYDLIFVHSSSCFIVHRNWVKTVQIVFQYVTVIDLNVV